ncbi:MAG TPA: nucleotide exchange factor GrpE, partial [Candidatus Saccharimonadales bacterium]|nr:nucleotide exchange factor GrpE [Candidatus Saccharimonadales bacterium]
MSKKSTDDQAQDQPFDQPLDLPDENQSVDVTAYEQQVADLTAALQRERADATNIRRNYDAQISGLRSTAKAGVIRDLLPVIDNFERSLKHIPADLEGNDYIKGIQGIVKQFEKTLT